MLAASERNARKVAERKAAQKVAPPPRLPSHSLHFSSCRHHDRQRPAPRFCTAGGPQGEAERQASALAASEARGKVEAEEYGRRLLEASHRARDEAERKARLWQQVTGPFDLQLACSCCAVAL